MTFDGILFDFDGVLIESEYAGNAQIAAWLSDNGHPTTAEESMHHFMGLSGDAFTGAVERWIGRPLPDGFKEFSKPVDFLFNRNFIFRIWSFNEISSTLFIKIIVQLFGFIFRNISFNNPDIILSCIFSIA